MTGLAVMEERARVDLYSLFDRLHEMGMVPLPLPNSTGSDDGLLWHRAFPDFIDTVAAWNKGYAVALRVPRPRNWADPFAPSPAIYSRVGTLHQAVSGLSGLEPYSGESNARHGQR